MDTQMVPTLHVLGSYFSILNSCFSWSALFSCVVVPGTLAIHMLYPRSIAVVFGFSLSQSVTTGFVSLQDEESALTRGVLMSLGRKNGLM